MKKHWYTTLFGGLAATGLALHNSGISIGHIGPIDFTALAAALGVAGLGATSADANKTATKEDIGQQ
jgi:hypothetical protein